MRFEQTIPILRIFAVDKAKEFYLGYLGFAVDWEHRFEPDLPLYMQVSRGELTLHLSEHHGDGSPGVIVFVRGRGLAELHRELAAKPYGHQRPGLERAPWGGSVMEVTDPFGNRIRFSDPAEPQAQ
jgi:catechol 2,3-dioxygenase-like lactoylglutathione lyase family enzyme